MVGIFAWIVRGLAYAGPAAIGYFFNDVASWFSSLMPSVNVQDKRTGGYAWWFVVGVMVVLGAVVLFVLKMFGGKKIKL